MNPQRYAMIITEDGSPSLVWDNESGGYEAMHHRGGALAETEWIYGEVVREIFQKNILSPGFISVGLGLGYNELVVAREALSVGSRDFRLLSFESDLGLVNDFANFLHDPYSCKEVYSKMRELMELPTAVFEELLRAQKEGRWLIAGKLDEQIQIDFPAHGILYDAFSSKSTPQLWSEEFLLKFLNQFIHPNETSIFTTYACTGNLKRALRSAGFTVCERPGFKGKRDSILARRERVQSTSKLR